jgi:hypothetical protein
MTVLVARDEYREMAAQLLMLGHIASRCVASRLAELEQLEGAA